MTRGVIVANPGSVSWMRESAAAFAATGQLERYFAPTVVSAGDLRRLSRNPLLPGTVRERLITELGRRQVTGEVGERSARVGTGLDLLRVGLERLPFGGSLNARLGPARVLAFDSRVARQLHAGAGALIGYQGATTAAFRRARELGIGTILDYPIAHPDVTERVLLEEKRLVPAYACTLPGVPYPRWRRRRYEEEIASADRIVVLSTYEQRTFEEAGVDPARMFIAPLCVDLEVFTPAPAPPDGPLRVAFVGQITQRKGLSYLVDGFHRAQLGVGAELLFIGPAIGSAEPWIREPGVRHVPAMPRGALPEVLRTCHVVALPSLIEGFGAAALEGMACGLPAVVTPHTFADDVVEDGADGWIVPIRDAGAIAERLRSVDTDRPLLARMSAAARAKAEQFPWERYREALRSGVAPLLATA